MSVGKVSFGKCLRADILNTACQFHSSNDTDAVCTNAVHLTVFINGVITNHFSFIASHKNQLNMFFLTYDTVPVNMTYFRST